MKLLKELLRDAPIIMTAGSALCLVHLIFTDTSVILTLSFVIGFVYARALDWSKGC